MSSEEAYHKYQRRSCGLYLTESQLSFDHKHTYIRCSLYKGFYQYSTVLNEQFPLVTSQYGAWANLVLASVACLKLGKTELVFMLGRWMAPVRLPYLGQDQFQCGLPVLRPDRFQSGLPDVG